MKPNERECLLAFLREELGSCRGYPRGDIIESLIRQFEQPRVFEVEKYVDIPVLEVMGWNRNRSAHHTEVWQPVGQKLLDEDRARQELKNFREYNKGKGLNYRLVKVIVDVNEE